MLSATTIKTLAVLPQVRVMVRDEVTSTNTLLCNMARDGAAEGTVLVARRQTAGRGRRERVFFSPPDSGLYLSLLLRPALPVQDSLSITVCGAVAMARAISDWGREVQIKWVNDLFYQGKKVCGILTEGEIDPESGLLSYAVLGLGVNLYPPEAGFPPELPQAGALFPRRSGPDDLENRLTASFLQHFFSDYPALREKPFLEEYRRRSLVLGQTIDIVTGETRRPAVALAIEDDFSLRVRESDGQTRCLSSGEVSIRPAEPGTRNKFTHYLPFPP